MVKKIKTESEILLNGTEPAKYIDPMTDFGFKKLFGEKGNTDRLKKFFKALLKYEGISRYSHYMSDDDDLVHTVHYRARGKQNFIVEIQKAGNDCFNDNKNEFFASFPMTYRKDKNSKIYDNANAIYVIGILNFVFSEDEGDDEYYYIHNADVFSAGEKEKFHDKTTFAYLALPKFNKKLDEVETPLDKWMYVLKNIALLNECPPNFGDVFKDLFNHAKIKTLSKEEKIAYNKSKKQN